MGRGTAFGIAVAAILMGVFGAAFGPAVAGLPARFVLLEKFGYPL